MSIVVQNGLPAKKILENENIFVMDENRAHTQQIRPLQICILNLMPLKEDTELDILRVMSNFPIQTVFTFMMMESHNASHVESSHLNKFYQTHSELKGDFFDGLIITGAPVEKMEFEDVDYWPELCEIMEWSKTHVYSTLHICWGAQAALYYHHGVHKHLLPRKLSGIYPHRVLHRKKMIMRGMDDTFLAPQSRYTGSNEEEINKNIELYTVAEGDETGSTVILAYSSRQVFMTCHTEYDRYDLDKEYHRDLEKGINPDIPVNYYPNDDPSQEPMLNWRSSSNTFFTNWLNIIYQGTPYDLRRIPPLEQDSYRYDDEVETIR